MARERTEVNTLINKYTPVGPRVLIRVHTEQLSEQKTASGIVLAKTTDDYRKAAARETGTIIALGDQAFKSMFDGTPWCNCGDTVVFRRYAGEQIVEEDEDGITSLRFVEDIDIFAIVNHGECPLADKIKGINADEYRVNEEERNQETWNRRTYKAQYHNGIRMK